mmetsp:Transcript_120634/g.209470  ORF Transcript_120634/g.209470 Transcript_120634/m.209470 type:complete len:206 (-) Transcript_120634:106-723(-)
MVFAATLKRRSDTAQSSFVEAVSAKIDFYVKKTMKQFESACAARADAGYTSCEFISDFRVINDLWKAGVHGSARSALRAVKSSIEQEMISLGFSSMDVQCRAEHSGDGVFHDPSHFMVFDCDAFRAFRFELFASWDGVADHQAPPAALPQGKMSQCPICFEMKAFVALTPCGHTLCRDCAASLTGGPCPSCRQQVTGFTRGLFID